ncbi:unnamed protein product [Ectocarpus sp. 6 AP-2014]
MHLCDQNEPQEHHDEREDQQHQNQGHSGHHHGRRRHLDIPVRRRGREPPRPTAPSEDGSAGGWQLHHSSTGLPFYYNRTTGESVWARGPTGTLVETAGGDDRNSKSAGTGLRRFSYEGHSDRSSASSGGSSGTSSTSSSCTGGGGGPREGGTSTSSSSETDSTSSASISMSGGSIRSDDDERKSSSSSSTESSDTSSSSGDSWTASMEMRFRRMMVSEEGRKMLAGEVQALTARQARRARRPPRGTETTRRSARRRRKSSTSSSLTYPGEGDDVEMALLTKPHSAERRNSSRIRSRSNSSSSSRGRGRGSSRGRGRGSSSSSSGSSSGSSSSSSDSTESSFSLNMSSGSDGGSDLSLLTSDIVLERLEKVEKILTYSREAAFSIARSSYGFATHASVVVWTAARRGVMRVRRFILSEDRFSPQSPPSPFTPAAI